MQLRHRNLTGLLMTSWLLFVADKASADFLVAADSSPLRDIAGGFHVGFGRVSEDVGPADDTTPELGVWLQLQVADSWWLAADWSYLPRDPFLPPFQGVPHGEIDRNRQHVDLTLQYHFTPDARGSFFVEGGFGFLWNNRTAVNPEFLPEYPEPGKESTRKNVFTIGAGYRRQVVPHLHWIVEGKAHNLSSSSKETLRLVTGLLVSLH
ncbi:MAG TPA: hypothetical protein PLM33_09430 [Acidobacteriota bacterium]|nr:hypothetical protein [Acidobacteriota bacterium]